jgi:hypothetical protein
MLKSSLQWQLRFEFRSSHSKGPQSAAQDLTPHAGHTRPIMAVVHSFAMGLPMRRLSVAMRSLSFQAALPAVRAPPPVASQQRKLSRCATQQTTRDRFQASNHQRLATSSVSPTSAATRPIIQSSGARIVAQQTRGMKVQSSVKKRCEHCKVRMP